MTGLLLAAQLFAAPAERVEGPTPAPPEVRWPVLGAALALDEAAESHRGVAYRLASGRSLWRARAEAGLGWGLEGLIFERAAGVGLCADLAIGDDPSGARQLLSAGIAGLVLEDGSKRLALYGSLRISLGGD